MNLVEMLANLPTNKAEIERIMERLPAEERKSLALKIKEAKQRLAVRKLFTYYPETGPLRRELYPKHMDFFRAGRWHRERCFMAANRIGKTEGAGGYETALHLTGRYPIWWLGKRFTRPVHFWAAGKTNETTRDIIQCKMFGKVTSASGQKEFTGTGLVPLEDIGRITWKRGVADFADTIQVKHQSGGWSQLGLKSYQQGRGSFEGTEQDGVWLDEEPPMDIYGECLIRTATTGGIVYTTFTPLQGMSSLAMSFLENGKRSGSERLL